MSREFSVRVSEDLARWVRWQGSPQIVMERLSVEAVEGRLPVTCPDPGPGPERLTVRFPEEGLSRLRKLTGSRKNLAALRKLFMAGYQNRFLPAAPQMLSERPLKNPTAILGKPGSTYHALLPAEDASGLPLAYTRGSAGVYYPLSPRVDCRPVRRKAGSEWLIGLLLIVSLPFLFYLFADQSEPSRPALKPRAGRPQDPPWLPETDSHLSKVVWGYE